MRNVTVGWSDLAEHDAAMGVAAGNFRPGPGYELVQPVFRLFAEATGDAPAKSVDEAKLARYYAARDRLALELHAADGSVIPTKTIHIVDFASEVGPDALELEIVVASPRAWRRLERSAAAVGDT